MPSNLLTAYSFHGVCVRENGEPFKNSQEIIGVFGDSPSAMNPTGKLEANLPPFPGCLGKWVGRVSRSMNSIRCSALNIA
jgi:hypothetical protein